MYCTQLITLRSYQHWSHLRINQGITHPKCCLQGVSYQSLGIAYWELGAAYQDYVPLVESHVSPTRTTCCLPRTMCDLSGLCIAYYVLPTKLMVNYPGHKRIYLTASTQPRTDLYDYQYLVISHPVQLTFELPKLMVYYSITEKFRHTTDSWEVNASLGQLRPI